MKTKFITLGYGIILITMCLVKADPNPTDVKRFRVILSKRQFLTFKYLCVLLGQEFGCDSIHPQTSITKDIIAICNVVYDLPPNYEFSFQPKSKEDIVRLTSEILQFQPELNSKDSECYYPTVCLSESQLFSFKNLCIKLGEKWGCDIHQDTPITEAIKAISDAPHNRPDAIRVHCSSSKEVTIVDGA